MEVVVPLHCARLQTAAETDSHYRRTNSADPEIELDLRRIRDVAWPAVGL